MHRAWSGNQKPVLNSRKSEIAKTHTLILASLLLVGMIGRWNHHWDHLGVALLTSSSLSATKYNWIG